MKKWVVPIILLAVLLAVPVFPASALDGGITFADPAFQQRFDRADLPVIAGVTSRSLIWGPFPNTSGLREPYVDSPGEERTVQYFDKSRMEINNPGGDPNNLFFVTNGLLVNEMITGNLQVGDAAFIPRGSGANIPVAGDPDNTFPTYGSLIRVFNFPAGRSLGSHVTSRFLPEGAADFPEFASDPNTEIVRIDRGFGIPRAFDNFMQFQGTVFQNGQFVPNQLIFPAIYLVGLPTTDAFWTEVRVAGVTRKVMFQAFERRLLTYTPSNPPAFQVEMGNVGQHYLNFRYATSGGGQPNIIITDPLPGARVAGTVHLQGQTSGIGVFENQLGVRILNAAGQEIARQGIFVSTFIAGAAGGPGVFAGNVPFPQPATTQAGTVEVFVTSAATGQVTSVARLPVTRTIERTPAVGTAALEELLFGTTQQEESAGFFSSIPNFQQLVSFPGRTPEWGFRVKLRSLSIDPNGVAFADFSRELEATAGGSVRVATVRQQITQTLKQFPAVTEVIISIEGKTEAILQP